MNKSVTINVSINSEVLPYVDGTLNQLELALAAVRLVWPHLHGAFSDLEANWEFTTEEQRVLFLESNPRLVHAISLVNELNEFLSQVPKLEGVG